MSSRRRCRRLFEPRPGRPLRINVVLPDWSGWPIGGYKVAYEYANHLAARGHRVRVLHLREYGGSDMVRRAYHLAAPVFRKLSTMPVPWFRLRSDIKMEMLRPSAVARVPDADVLLLTGWRTAVMTEPWPLAAGQRVQLVYDYEFWKTADAPMRAQMAAAFRSSAVCVATSAAVAEMLGEAGASAAVTIHCGLNHTIFAIRTPIETRGTVLMFPLRPEPFKGAADAIAAAILLRRELGERLHVIAYGSKASVALLRAGHGTLIPAWVEVVISPTDRELASLYNRASMLLLASKYEGWGLPAVEAMACGAAVVLTDSGGIRDFARDSETALVVQHGDVRAMAAAVRCLIEEPQRRVALARAGCEEVGRFTWQSATDELELVLRGAIGSAA